MDTYKEAQEDDNEQNDEKETKKNSEVSKDWPALKLNICIVKNGWTFLIQDKRPPEHSFSSPDPPVGLWTPKFETWSFYLLPLYLWLFTW